jgi:hypothetical protein
VLAMAERTEGRSGVQACHDHIPPGRTGFSGSDKVVQ